MDREKEVEVDIMSSEIQSQISSQKQIRVSVNFKNYIDSCYRSVRKYIDSQRPPVRIIIKFLIYCLLILITYPFLLLATAVVMPVLFVAVVVVRLLQFCLENENFETLFSLKLKLRYLVAGMVLLVSVEMGIFYPIAKYVPRLKLITILGLPITKCILLLYILIGFFFVSQIVWCGLSVIIAQVATGRSIRGAFVLESISEIFGCVLYRLAEILVINTVPKLKNTKIFEIYAPQWIEVGLYLLIGYNIIVLLTCLVVCSLSIIFARMKDHLVTQRYVVYVANGIERSIIFVLSVLMLLLTWVFYFGERLNKTIIQGQKISEFGLWSLVSVLICSVLWLIKDCVLLYWKAHVVYNKLYLKIRETGEHLYYFVLFCMVCASTADLSSDLYGWGLFTTPPENETLWFLLSDNQYETRFRYKSFNRKIVRETLIKRQYEIWSVYELQQAAQLFFNAQLLLSDASKEFRNDPSFIKSNDESNWIDYMSLIVPVNDEDNNSKNDHEQFIGLLGASGDTKDIIQGNQVMKWVERAHTKCSFLANTLIGEEEAAMFLNKVMCVVIIGVTFIIWLLLSGLTTTSVIVLVATPMLAASFIFGDSCKALFQGLMFVYVVHPFSVADMCIIDKKLLEVKRMGVWNCIFVEVQAADKEQEIIYTNMELGSKNIIKCKRDLDWDDCVELSLSFEDKDTMDTVKADVEQFLNKAHKEFVQNLSSVEFRDTGENCKMVINVRYEKPKEELTYFEYLKEKERRRYNLSIQIRTILKQQHKDKKTGAEEKDQDQDLIIDEPDH